MGTIERRVRRGELKRAILQVVALGGLVALAVAAPNMPKAIPRSLLDRIFGSTRNTRNVVVARLVKEGCVVREMHHGRCALRITKKGRDYLSKEGRIRAIARPRRWDRKWRVIIFDIKEPNRRTRDLLRRELNAVGFRKVQGSVWAYPFPCEEYIALLKADMRIGKDVLYLVVDELENDRVLREHFSLPSRT